MKIKNEKRTVFRLSFFHENEKRMRVLKIQIKTLFDMKMVVSPNACTENIIRFLI